MNTVKTAPKHKQLGTKYIVQDRNANTVSQTSHIHTVYYIVWIYCLVWLHT